MSLNDLAAWMDIHRSTLWRYEGMAEVPAEIVTRYRECLYAQKAVA